MSDNGWIFEFLKQREKGAHEMISPKKRKGRRIILGFNIKKCDVEKATCWSRCIFKNLIQACDLLVSSNNEQTQEL